MRSEDRASLDYASRWLPFVFAAIAVAGMLFIARVQPEPIVGEVLRVREGSGGTLFATVEFLDDSQVPIWTGNEHVEPRVGHFGYIGITPRLVLISAAIAALLGKVVEMTIRGYGYVPGTGESGQTPPGRVAEDRGFYWRT